MTRLVGLDESSFFSDVCTICMYGGGVNAYSCLVELDDDNKTARLYFDCCGGFTDYYNDAEQGYEEHSTGPEFTAALKHYAQTVFSDGMW